MTDAWTAVAVVAAAGGTVVSGVSTWFAWKAVDLTRVASKRAQLVARLERNPHDDATESGFVISLPALAPSGTLWRHVTLTFGTDNFRADVELEWSDDPSVGRRRDAVTVELI